ncbi:MAG: hypothetical protein WBL31_15315 [Ilumatobacteraceae bacterium]
MLATIPVVLWPATAELDAVRWTLALFIALVGFQVARTNGAGTARSVVYGGVLFVTELAVALLKNVLSGH